MTESHPWAPEEARRIDLLHEGWELASCPPGACPDPAAAMAAGLAWHPAAVPGTVAQSLDLALDGAPDLDGVDWWYRCTFAAEPRAPGEEVRLRFEGLATLAEVWLNGARLAESRGMFTPLACDVSGLLRERNELLIHFRALGPELSARRPRPRWKTALVAQQNLRWIRTTLLGRIPGWSPALPPVGPWREVRLERIRRVDVLRLDLQAWAVGPDGHASVAAEVRVLDGHRITSAVLRVGDRDVPLKVVAGPASIHLSGQAALPGAPLWWPHTHGEPARLEASLRLEAEAGPLTVEVGRIGFKAVAVDRSEGQVRLVVNGRPVFARGACWTPADIRALEGDSEILRHTLTLARDAGLNLLRVGGTMVYESEAFYDLCDELGILVWQDFMFANMDYPFAAPDFHAEVAREVDHQLGRLQRHPCLAVYCGGSEIEQQAAMLGLPASEWSGPFFAEELPALCAARHPGIPYFPSTPTEGVLPFHPSAGLAHYYGVGAYRRPLADARLARVRFTPECLGFSNVPDEEGVEDVFGGARPVTHHPRWKAGVPRDSGAGWDFEDVRDHYLRALSGLDPVELRSGDPERYLALSREISGEVMKAVFAEWRRPGSGCGGALVWFLRDLRPGAGWGILDSAGRPKAAYWHLRRAWARRALLLTDEGLEGLHLHLVNETDQALEGHLELELLRDGRVREGRGEQAASIPAWEARTYSADALMGAFSDLTYAYRFGPPRHDVALARFISTDGRTVLEDVHFPQGWRLPFQETVGIHATVAEEAGGAFVLSLESPVFLQAVSLACRGHRPEDDHFHLAPGRRRRIRFTPRGDPAAPFRAELGALNLRETLPLRADP